MSPLIENALRTIESDDPKAVAEGFIVLAEVVAANRIRNFRSEIIADANKETLEWGPLEQIQRVVQNWIERNPYHVHTASAFAVLDKFRDNSLRPFLRTWLDHYVQHMQPYLASLGQIVTGLRSLGEAVIADPSYSTSEPVRNLDDAIRYLNAEDLRPITKLTNALLEAESALSKYSDRWHVELRQRCEMCRCVLGTAPRAIRATAAREIARSFHPKAELSIDPDLQSRVETLALELIKPDVTL